VTEAELRKRLLADPVPDEVEAGRRSWEVVRAAYAARERTPWIERHSRVVIAVAAAAALAVAAVTPPGRALVESVRDRVTGETPSAPALSRLPTGGRLLVESPQGPWVVRQDGSKRRLGNYGAASWSPHGLFVVATTGRQLVALGLDKTGDVRWTVTGSTRLSDPRWAPSGFRIAYRAHDALRIVIGNGEGDHLLTRGVAPIPPAWKPAAVPNPPNVLAYADDAGVIHVVDVDTREEFWSARAGPGLEQLVWSGDGRRLLALSAGERQRLFTANGRAAGTIHLPPGHELVDAAFLRGSRTLAYVDFDPNADQSKVVLREAGSSRPLDSEDGRLEDVTWSPDGHWLLVAWPSADQWLFLRAPTGRGLSAVRNIGREFDPGGTGRAFPRVSGWVEDRPESGG
jgi:hypothetical protein